MFSYAPLLGQVKLVAKPSALGEVNPASVDLPVCDSSNIAYFRGRIDEAAARIASSQKAMQDAVAAGDQGAIDRANVSANQANQDWQAWSQGLQGCKNFLSEKGPTIGPIIALLAAVAVVGSVIVIPKLMK